MIYNLFFVFLILLINILLLNWSLITLNKFTIKIWLINHVSLHAFIFLWRRNRLLNHKSVLRFTLNIIVTVLSLIFLFESLVFDIFFLFFFIFVFWPNSNHYLFDLILRLSDFVFIYFIFYDFIERRTLFWINHQ